MAGSRPFLLRAVKTGLPRDRFAAMNERVRFASEIMARLSAAGVQPLPTYDAGSDMLILPRAYDGRAVHIQLSRFFDRYRMADASAHQGTGAR